LWLIEKRRNAWEETEHGTTKSYYRKAGKRNVEQTLGQHQQDNTITYLGVRELLRDDKSREEEELDLIPMHL